MIEYKIDILCSKELDNFLFSWTTEDGYTGFFKILNEDNMNQKLVRKYRRLKKIGWVDVLVLITFLALSILAGILGLAMAETIPMRVLFCFVLVGVPILAIFSNAKFEKYCIAVERKFNQMFK